MINSNVLSQGKTTAQDFPAIYDLGTLSTQRTSQPAALVIRLWQGTEWKTGLQIQTNNSKCITHNRL